MVSYLKKEHFHLNTNVRSSLKKYIFFAVTRLTVLSVGWYIYRYRRPFFFHIRLKRNDFGYEFYMKRQTFIPVHFCWAVASQFIRAHSLHMRHFWKEIEKKLNYWIWENEIKKILLHEKKVSKKVRVCHNHKPQPTLDTKRKWKRTKTYTRKTNKQMHEKHKDQLPLPQARWSEC